jgi:hypothetical protein
LLYQLRQCIDQGNRITDAIRTNISFLKIEKTLIKYKYGIKDYKQGYGVNGSVPDNYFDLAIVDPPYGIDAE